MKAPTLQMVQVLCLIGFFTGPLQVLCLKAIPLDMSHNSVDDQYINCNPPKVLPPETSGYIPVPRKYKASWEIAKKHWAELGKSTINLTPMQGTAVMAYTRPGNLYGDFNTATRGAGKSKQSYSQFAFKDFFFLLSKAVQARMIQGKCHEVFRGVQNIHYKVRIGQRVRFGQFASSSLERAKAEKFCTATLFSIKTCHGVPIYDISLVPDEKEVLILPYETFVVKSKEKVSPSDWNPMVFIAGSIVSTCEVQVTKHQRGGRSLCVVSF